MSGPIVRTGTTPEFWKNWDSVFGAKPDEGKKAKVRAAKRSAAKKAAPKTAAKKSAKKAAPKK